jgi:lysine---8-amino-7-oxononanoate aminotransferase
MRRTRRNADTGDRMTSACSKLWLPFTQMAHFNARPREFVRAEGTRLFDSGGHGLYDAVSSIWTIVHGHGHPLISEAIASQARRLDHATMLGATNPPAIALAEQLCALTGMSAALFASDGASAVEAAIKIALQYWQNVGEPRRTRFVRLVDAYHGDTAGAMSVSGIALFKSRFSAITFDSVPYGTDSLDQDDVAAVIVEPIVQAAAGMRVVLPAHYAPLRAIAPLLIVDEIATGFGRTGAMFAFESLGLQPDLLCLGKALSGGALALSATLSSDRIFEAFLGELGANVHFLHGHSYAGNPIACAAALASLDVFERDSTLERAAGIARCAARRVDALKDHPAVADVRQAGTMIGVEIRAEAMDPQATPTVGWHIADRLYECGHFTRPIGNVVQFVPPLSSSDAEIDAFFDALEEQLA